MIKKKTKKLFRFGFKRKPKSKSTLVILAAVVVVVLVSGVIGSWLYIGEQTQSSGDVVAMSPTTVDARRDRIEAIYDSLKIGDDYTLTAQNVFGAKVLYSYDKGRSFSSYKDYVHSANVDTTAKDLRAKIEAAGFKFIGEPYPGSTEIQYHFESAKNEFVRMTVTSKPRDDYRTVDAGLYALDPNAGPSKRSGYRFIKFFLA